MVPKKIVLLFDVDNTLLDNDHIVADLMRYLERAIGHERQQRYWMYFEQLRSELGYADYLGALQRYRIEHPRDPQLLQVSLFLLEYPFAERLFPQALEVVAALRARGPVVIFSDGDVVFQPRKVQRSGLWAAVDGRVLIYIHKEEMLEDVESRYPARRYVVVDDKLRILAAIKKAWQERVTTVFVRQGHYAHDLRAIEGYAPADVTIDRIADLPAALTRFAEDPSRAFRR